MLNRRAVMVCTAAAVSMAMTRPLPACAEADFKPLLAFLPDFEGWNGDKPNGMSLDTGNGKMTTAAREYHRGPAKVSIVLLCSPSAAAQVVTGMNMQMNNLHILSATIDGFNALKTFDGDKKSGALLIALDENALFNLSYDGIAEEDASTLLTKVDLKALEAALPK
jgi:hypothetical protein